jgi:hypothetical protein
MERKIERETDQEYYIPPSRSAVRFWFDYFTKKVYNKKMR